MTDYTHVVGGRLHLFRDAAPFLPRHNPTTGNPEFALASYRVLIVRLSPFRDVDRSVPHLFLWQEMRRALPHAYIDLAFFPDQADRAALDELGAPYLLGTRSMRSIEDFDLALISNAYTLELVNLPFLLIHSRVPLFASERDDRYPPLILGGSNAPIVQAIVREDGDSVVDGIYFGEGEGRVARLVAALTTPGASKAERLHAAASQVQGFWAAGELRPVAKAVARQPRATDLPLDYPLLNSPKAHTTHLQITYGCPAFCSFCFEGYDRKPYRELPTEELLDVARQLKVTHGSEEVSLDSFNFNTHRDILSLPLSLHRLYDRVSLMSQRVDILQRVGGLLDAEIAAGKASFTLGIEGISERQRAFLHKSLPTEDIVSLLERLLGKRIREIKLFFILTGHESDKDIIEFRAFVRQLKAVRRAGNRGIRVIFSFGLLIRMPFTPLRYDRLYLDEAHWRPLIGQAKSTCETNGFEFRLAFDWPTYCVTQVLALGGHWLTETVVALARAGHCFDGGISPEYWEALRAWMVKRGHWGDAFLAEKSADHVFAMDWVSSDIQPGFLYRQFQAARAGKDRGYCLGSADGDGTCLGCGACADAEQRRTLTMHRIHEPIPSTGMSGSSYLAELRAMVARKRRLQPVYWHVRLAGWLGGVHPAFLFASCSGAGLSSRMSSCPCAKACLHSDPTASSQ